MASELTRRLQTSHLATAVLVSLVLHALLLLQFGRLDFPGTDVAVQGRGVLNLSFRQIAGQESIAVEGVRSSPISGTGSQTPDAGKVARKSQRLVGRDPSRSHSVHFPVAELDERPRAIAVANPESILDAFPHAGGRVKLRLWINADGVVIRAIVTDAGGLPEVFSQSAQRVFYRSRFKPGIKAGQAVSSVVTMVVNYPSWPPDG